MPFGLCIVPSTFERLMEKVLYGLQWKIFVVYLDGVIVFGPTVEKVLRRLKIVLQRLWEAKKCHLFEKQVLNLGHVVSEEGVGIDPAKNGDSQKLALA